MKSLGQLIALAKKEQMERQTSLVVSSPKTSQLASSYGPLTSFLKEFNPSVQMELCQYPDICYFGDLPTLGKVRNDYGSNAAVTWLIPQLFDLSEYCGCKGKITEDQLQQCASVIATTYHYLKVSELMLFFFKFKSAQYGRFYGSVDPLVITSALREFIRERNNAIDRHEQEERERQEREARKNTISWEEYCMKTYGELRPHPMNRFMNENKEP